MSVRADLLALTPDKLAVLANRGLVKRAAKVLARGDGPIIMVDGDIVVAVDGDVRTEFRPGLPLSDTRCSCPSSSVCRHRVAAVMAYQAHVAGDPLEAEIEPADVGWCPGDISDEALTALLGTRLYRRAQRHRRQGYVATVHRPKGGDDSPSVELPSCTVRFLVPNDAAYARCDCRVATGCEHVPLAVWAFREAEPGPAIHEQLVELPPSDAAKLEATPMSAAMELVSGLLLDGAVHGGGSVGAAFAQARRGVESAAMRWPADVLEELEAKLTAYRGRHATYRGDVVGELICELFARERAARRVSEVPTQLVLGVGEARETALGHVRLESLGAELHEHEAGVRARVFFADTDSATVLVLERSWPHGEDDAERPTSETYGRRQVVGARLDAMARGRVVSTLAKRRANRALLLGRGRIAQTAVTPQSGAWDQLPEPIYVPDLEAEVVRRRRRPPRFLRARVLAEDVRAIAVDEVVDLVYRPGQQLLEAVVRDPQGCELHLSLEHRRVTPHALDAATAALAGEHGELRFVSGALVVAGGKLTMRPLAFVTDAVVVPDFAAETQAVPIPQRDVRTSPDALFESLSAGLALLDEAAHRGLRHGGDLEARLRGSASKLRGLGLPTCAARLVNVAEGMSRAVLSREFEAEQRAVRAWVDASLRFRLALESA